jgi:hypothetical protein
MSEGPAAVKRTGGVVAWWVPAGADAALWTVLAARGLRALADGYMAVLLPAYLLALGLGTFEVGVAATTTLLGSALATLAVGAWGHRVASSRLLSGAALLMAATGLGFAGLTSLWPLLVVAFIGTLNPSAGDVSVFLPLEHARLAAGASGAARTVLFARWRVVAGRVGALAAGCLMCRAAPALSRLTRCGRCSCCSAIGCGCCIGGARRASSRPQPRRRRRWGRRAASSCAWQRCSASMPSRAAWSSTRCSRCGCCSASTSRSRRPACSSSGPACSAPHRNW